MFVEITNEPREYDWGSTTVIPEFLGRPVTGRPQAELWLGTHPGSPARLVGRDGTLAEIVDPPLPFLLKLLAVAHTLSIQAHPDAARAAAGFARENALGIPLDATERNYRDASAKPELLVALEDGFLALARFRPVGETRRVLAEADDPRIAEFASRLTDDVALPTVVAWLLSGDPAVAGLVDALVAAAASGSSATWDAIRRIAATHARDPGVAVAALLNAARLGAGEAVFLGAGVPHVYIEGVGVELMAASDNVLRGGLTTKHVDVDELLAVADFTPGPIPMLPADHAAPGVRRYRPSMAGLELLAIDAVAGGPPIVVIPEGAAILLGVRGALGIEGGPRIERGTAIYVADEGPIALAGAGEVFLAAAGWSVAEER